MAVSHIAYTATSQHGGQLRRCLQQIEEGVQGLSDMLAAMALMIDGDGTSAAHFTYVTTKFGFATDAVAKAAYEELLSLGSKFNRDTSVTNVKAAMTQAFAKFR